MLASPLRGNVINGVLGDHSLFEAFPTSSTDATPEKERIVIHLRYVYNLIQGQSTSNLTLAQRQNRVRCLSHLLEYIERGEFPQPALNQDAPQDRRPCFRDDSGCVCAVGYLVEKTAGVGAVTAINDAHKYEYIYTMKDNCQLLLDWQHQMGLSLPELAMIQPTYDFMRQPWATPNLNPVTPPVIQPVMQPAMPTVVHTNVRCDSCGANPIVGIRYKCGNCADFDLCSICEAYDQHDNTHVFLKIRRPLAVTPRVNLLTNNLYFPFANPATSNDIRFD